MAYDIVSGADTDIDAMVNAVGEEYEIGADGAVRRKVPRRGAAPAGQRPGFQRTAAQIQRRPALGFGAFSIATTATATLTARPQRAFKGNRLLIVPSAAGLLIQSFRIGDEEQLLNPGVPVEMYGPLALADDPDDFTPLASGMDAVLVLSNPTGGTITGSAGIKGFVFR